MTATETTTTSVTLGIEAQFQAALAENPEDTHARMAYADWLAENGRDWEAALQREHLGMNATGVEEWEGHTITRVTISGRKPTGRVDKVPTEKQAANPRHIFKKPVWHYIFKSIEQREQHIANWKGQVLDA